jgi:hypothetical protein
MGEIVLMGFSRIPCPSSAGFDTLAVKYGI